MKKNPTQILNEPEVITPPDVEPELPHEKDESTDGMASSTRNVIMRASKDLKCGLHDTDRGPEMTKAYKKQK